MTDDDHPWIEHLDEPWSMDGAEFDPDYVAEVPYSNDPLETYRRIRAAWLGGNEDAP